MCQMMMQYICYSRWLRVESCNKKGRHLFFEMDQVGDTWCSDPSVIPEGDEELSVGEQGLEHHQKRVPECRDWLLKMTENWKSGLTSWESTRNYLTTTIRREWNWDKAVGTSYYSRALEQSGSCWELPGARILKRNWMKRSMNKINCHQGRVRICGTWIWYTSWFCLIVSNLKRKLIKLKMSYQKKWSQAFASV